MRCGRIFRRPAVQLDNEAILLLLLLLLLLLVLLLLLRSQPYLRSGDNAIGGPTGLLNGDDGCGPSGGLLNGDDGRGPSGVIVEVELDDRRDKFGDRWNECDDVRGLFGGSGVGGQHLEVGRPRWEV